MGNTCCKKTTTDDDNDRSRIINGDNNNYDTPQGIGNAQEGEYYINFNGVPPDDDVPYGSYSCGNKTQEQAALDRIYHRLALNVIDVAPGETMIIQPAEICERQKLYQSRMNQLEGLLSLSSLTKSGTIQRSAMPFSSKSSNKLVSRLKLQSSSSTSSPEPHTTSTDNSGNINRQKLYQIPDRRRVEYEAIPRDEEALIREYSLRSVKAVKSLSPTINEPVITQFNLRF